MKKTGLTLLVAARIKAELLRHNMSTYQLAKKSGLNPSTLQRIVNGEISPSLDTVEKICAIFPVLSFKA